MGRGPPTRTCQVCTGGSGARAGDAVPGDTPHAQPPDAQTQRPRDLSGDRKLARRPHIQEVDALDEGLGPVRVVGGHLSPLLPRGPNCERGSPHQNPQSAN